SYFVFDGSFGFGEILALFVDLQIASAPPTFDPFDPTTFDQPSFDPERSTVVMDWFLDEDDLPLCIAEFDLVPEPNGGSMALLFAVFAVPMIRRRRRSVQVH
ncbi:MAG: hypothetical protein AAF497_12210, partial [Planctomycetota bacterium]